MEKDILVSLLKNQRLDGIKEEDIEIEILQYIAPYKNMVGTILVIIFYLKI